MPLHSLAPCNSTPLLVFRGPNWVEEFPLHKAAYEGNAKEVKELVQKSYSVTKKDKDSWAPIHYAAWLGSIHTNRKQK